jgi:hypothetical protein
MSRYYDELAAYDRGGMLVVVDKTYEDLHPRDCFDDSVTDIAELCDKIERGVYDWFMLRVRILLDGHELATEYLGGMLYEDPNECLTDGTAEDIIDVAMVSARQEIVRLKDRLASFA